MRSKVAGLLARVGRLLAAAGGGLAGVACCFGVMPPIWPVREPYERVWPVEPVEPVAPAGPVRDVAPAGTVDVGTVPAGDIDAEWAAFNRTGSWPLGEPGRS
ncbi:hypothetical protein KZZ52_34370 [Dactylosporangium sp. AC04546]|uniref:hypothetical protein n=1 Tax=Dactylosporangium sp. AC04546 TaxID=2862460 RepID=UPI001EE06096|nr:hypothetical protein [Dactylosporangium sp. AC04546]WVK79058.1 hypothetical protein KZZ52_34370 [Dactylosporangium sp. AC04546]